MAVVTASIKPWSVFGAKYTAILGPGATAPRTSMSSMTSPSGPLGSARLVLGIEDAHRFYRGSGDPQVAEVGVEVRLLKPAAELDYGGALAAARRRPQGNRRPPPPAAACTVADDSQRGRKWGWAWGRSSSPKTPVTTPSSSAGMLRSPSGAWNLTPVIDR